jgi:hypothetical protein
MLKQVVLMLKLLLNLFTEPNKLLMGTEEGLYVALLNKDGKINVTTAKKKNKDLQYFTFGTLV